MSSNQNEESRVAAINLEAMLSTFSGCFQPRTDAQFNGHDVMVVKTKGEFVLHKHDDTDDFFLVRPRPPPNGIKAGAVSRSGPQMTGVV